MLVVLRDIKEDFLVKIIDMNGQSSWMFAQVDTVVTLIILALFGAMVFVKSNIKVLVALLGLVVLGTATMSFISFNYMQSPGCLSKVPVCILPTSVFKAFFSTASSLVSR